ncbi:MAG: hypothetical protein GF344_01595 [Chitinivibrionales bacterium]|nr:hypothetical protein [Chitinivibrionales bacterium]
MKATLVQEVSAGAPSHTRRRFFGGFRRFRFGCEINKYIVSAVFTPQLHDPSSADKLSSMMRLHTEVDHRRILLKNKILYAQSMQMIDVYCYNGIRGRVVDKKRGECGL